MSERERATLGGGGPAKNFRQQPDSTPQNAPSSSRQHRPYARWSYDDLNAAIRNLRGEKRRFVMSTIALDEDGDQLKAKIKKLKATIKSLKATIKRLYDEKRYRRDIARLYHIQADRHRRKGAYGRAYQVQVMRRYARLP
jgi:chromosome segregation ATPase